MTPGSLCTIPDKITLHESRLIDIISNDKIKFQVRQMSTTSTCGNDGITVIMLWYLLENLLLDIFVNYTGPVCEKDKRQSGGMKL